LEIARTIGKVDATTGAVLEGFRGDILGFLGSSPNYQELYKKAVVDRDYQRTAEELAQMIQLAAQASEALQSLAQDLTAFNLEHYRQLQGELSLDDLRVFMERAILRMGGTFIRDGDFVRIETPQALLKYRDVAARYDMACFSRPVAMRRKNADFMGIGHPLVDATIAHLARSACPGEVTVLDTGGPVACSVRYVLEAVVEDGSVRKRYESVRIGPDESWQAGTAKEDLGLLSGRISSAPVAPGQQQVQAIRQRVQAAVADSEARIRGEHDKVQSVRTSLAGAAWRC